MRSFGRHLRCIHKEITMKKQDTAIVSLIVFCLIVLLTGVPCQAGQQSWGCPNDDEVNGTYRICNYFPLDPGNQWLYTTGNYYVVNDIHKCSSGYSGILFATDTFDYDSYIQNQSLGFVHAGCQYYGDDLEDWGKRFVIIPPQMEVGQTATASLTHFGQRTIMDTTLAGLESVTVDAGTFDTLKIELMINDIGKCTYKTTLWLAKGIGPVKIHRTDPNPADCGGCIFVCNPDESQLNTPAELVSYSVDSSQGPDLAGSWTFLTQACKDTRKGTRCKINGKLNIQNDGLKNAAPSKVKFYLSDDNVFDAEDTYLKERTVRNIKTGEGMDKNLRYAFPYGQTLTGKYIIAVVDEENTVVEVNETNNEVVYGPLQ